MTRQIVLTGCLAATGLLTACDDSSQQDQQSRAALTQAITTLTDAQRGYADGGGDETYQTYRTTQLQEAAQQLEQVIAKGSGSAKTEAQRLLADVRLSQARQLIQNARLGQAEVEGRLEALFNKAAAVERINDLIVTRGGDDEAVLSALKEGDDLVRQSKAGVSGNLAELSAQREAALINAETYHGQASEHFNQAEQAEQQAFVAENDQARRQAETRAYQARLKGSSAQRQASEAQIEADRLGLEVARLQNEAQLWDQMAQQISSLTQKVRDDGEAASRDVSTADSSRNLGVAAVRETLDALVQRYRQDVEQPLNEAVAKTDAALSRIDNAISQGAAANRTGLRFDRLSLQVERARALSQHAAAAKQVAAAVAAVADSPVMKNPANASTAQEIDAVRSSLAEQAQALSQSTRDTIADSMELTEQLAEDQNVGEATQSLAKALQAYGQQLN